MSRAEPRVFCATREPSGFAAKGVDSTVLLATLSVVCCHHDIHQVIAIVDC